MRACIFLIFLVGCGGSKPVESASPSTANALSTATSTSTATSPSTASAPPTTAPVAIPTGGSVLVGDIAAAKKFDPKRAIEANTPALLECYNKIRATKAELSGRLKLLIEINEAGTVLRVDSEPGGSANDPALVACIGEALKATKFPKPGGMATVIAPLVFRP
jgi:hypothetical protein